MEEKPVKVRKKSGRKVGSHIPGHGAYSLIATGEFPASRKYVERHLSKVRAAMIRDLGPGEENLTAGQRILIDRVISKLGVLRLVEEHVRENGVLKGENLVPPLGKDYIVWSNSLRLDLMALGIKARKADEVLDPLAIARQIDAAKGEEGK